MTQQQLQSIIQNGENITVEFKKCTTELTHSVFETVCSFFKSDGWAETLFDRANLLIKKILNKEERSLNEDKRPLNENKRLKRPLNEDKWPLKRPLNECERPINGKLKQYLVNIILSLIEEDGIKRNVFIEKSGKKRTTITQCLQILRDANMIEYIGSKKTGGYYLTRRVKNMLQRDVLNR